MSYFLKFLRGKRSSRFHQTSNNSNLQKKNMEDDVLDSDLSQNTENLQLLFSQAPDLVIRRFPIAASKTEAALVYLPGLTDKDAIHNYVLKPLMHSSFDPNKELPITIGKIEMVYTWGQIENAILGGDSVLLLNGQITGYQLYTKGWPQRQLNNPQNEISLKGANQGFVETGSQNIALIRRYIPHQELILKEMTVGIRGKTKVSLLYLRDVASEDVLRELETRIQNITVDAIINTGELIEFIEDNPYSPFPQIMLTERPDTAASQILQGRFVIIMDRSPSVLIAPTNFISFFQAVDDYGSRWLVSSFIRVMRFFAFMIALFLPALTLHLLRIAITERLFPFNVRKDTAKLQKSIETKLQADFERLIKKTQTATIDPFGFGIYARAYTYPEWKKVQNQWGKAFSKADVNVKVRVTIGGMGTIK